MTRGSARAEPDGTRAETRIRLSPKRTIPFESAEESVQLIAGSRGVRISVSNAGYTTSRGRVRVLATHSIRQFPLHLPSRASPCATTFRTQYTNLMQKFYLLSQISLHVSGIYKPIFRSTGCLLIHMVFSTRCCGCDPEESVCSLVHCV